MGNNKPEYSEQDLWDLICWYRNNALASASDSIEKWKASRQPAKDWEIVEAIKFGKYLLKQFTDGYLHNFSTVEDYYESFKKQNQVIQK